MTIIHDFVVNALAVIIIVVIWSYAFAVSIIVVVAINDHDEHIGYTDDIYPPSGDPIPSIHPIPLIAPRCNIHP